MSQRFCNRIFCYRSTRRRWSEERDASGWGHHALLQSSPVTPFTMYVGVRCTIVTCSAPPAIRFGSSVIAVAPDPIMAIFLPGYVSSKAGVQNCGWTTVPLNFSFPTKSGWYACFSWEETYFYSEMSLVLHVESYWSSTCIGHLHAIRNMRSTWS